MELTGMESDELLKGTRDPLALGGRCHMDSGNGLRADEGGEASAPEMEGPGEKVGEEG